MFLVKFDILPMAFIWKDWGKYDEKPQDSQYVSNFEQEIAWPRNRSANRDVHYQYRIFGYPRRLQYELYRTVAAREANRIPSPVESCHNISGDVKGKWLNCFILHAVVAGDLEELKKFGTYYIAGSPIERVTLRLLQETFPPPFPHHAPDVSPWPHSNYCTYRHWQPFVHWFVNVSYVNTPTWMQIMTVSPNAKATSKWGCPPPPWTIPTIVPMHPRKTSIPVPTNSPKAICRTCFRDTGPNSEPSIPMMCLNPANGRMVCDTRLKKDACRYVRNL